MSTDEKSTNRKSVIAGIKELIWTYEETGELDDERRVALLTTIEQQTARLERLSIKNMVLRWVIGALLVIVGMGLAFVLPMITTCTRIHGVIAECTMDQLVGAWSLIMLPIGMVTWLVACS